MSQYAIFPTDLGWFGIVGANHTVARLLVGHVSADEVRQAIHASFVPETAAEDLVECDWWPELRRRLENYSRGETVAFDDCLVAAPQRTEFQRRVQDLTRRIPYGQTVTYAQLAERAGAPGAARAVGNAMARNPVPIIVPCHRVVAAGGRLGGYSAPQGVSLKRRLLEMESAAELVRC